MRFEQPLEKLICYRELGLDGFAWVGGSTKLSGENRENAIQPTAHTASAIRKATIHRNGRLDFESLVFSSMRQKIALIVQLCVRKDRRTQEQ